MLGMELETGVAGWKALTNPLSYGGTPRFPLVIRLVNVGSALNFSIKDLNLTKGNCFNKERYDYKL